MFFLKRVLIRTSDKTVVCLLLKWPCMSFLSCQRGRHVCPSPFQAADFCWASHFLRLCLVVALLCLLLSTFTCNGAVIFGSAGRGRECGGGGGVLGFVRHEKVVSSSFDDAKRTQWQRLRLLLSELDDATGFLQFTCCIAIFIFFLIRCPPPLLLFTRVMLFYAMHREGKGWQGNLVNKHSREW